MVRCLQLGLQQPLFISHSLNEFITVAMDPVDPDSFFGTLTSLLKDAVPIGCGCTQLDDEGREFEFKYRKYTLRLSMNLEAPRHKSASGVLSKEGARRTHKISVWTMGPPFCVSLGKKVNRYRTIRGAVCELVSFLIQE